MRANIVRTSRRAPRRQRTCRTEPLEARTMLSVSQDANGWTIVTPSADSRVVYVSSSGSDNNDGLSTATPIKSLSKAGSLMRNGFPDQILLKRGDIFFDNFPTWTKSGRSVDEPMLLGNYGTGERPLIKTGTANAGFVTANNANTTVQFIDIIGLQFIQQNHDPSSPTYSYSSTGGISGIELKSKGGDMLIENCSIRYYRNNIDIEGVWATVNNITIRRCVVADSWSNNGNNSQGFYSYNTNNVSVLDNVFDHNGWNEQITGAPDTGHNHNIYFSFNVMNVRIERNILANASFAAIMARSGGTIKDNLILHNTVAVTFGNANGANSTEGGVVGELSGNVVIDDKALGTLKYGQGFEIGNTKPGVGVVVQNNILALDTQQAKDAIQLTMATGTYTPEDTVGENDLTIQNNITYGWYRGLMTDGRFVPGGTGLYAFNNVTIRNNDFINNPNRVVRHDGKFDPKQEHWSGNRYYTQYLTKPNWFLLHSRAVSYAQWANSIDKTGTALTSIPYADPDRTAASYNASLGGPATLTDYLAQARLLSDTHYDTRYIAQAAIDYIRKGFTLDTAAPVAAVSAPAVGASSLGAGTYTFDVTYTDDFFINRSTLDSNDILVTGPNGFSRIATLVVAAPSTTGPGGYQSTVATYRFTAPSGAWSAGAGGTYTVSLRSKQVKDTAGNSIASGALGTFAVDLAPPTAAASAENLDDTALGSATYTFTVSYADASGIDLTTLGDGDVEVTGPNDYNQLATLLGSIPGPAGSIVATYSVLAPDGAWGEQAGGDYKIAARPGEVSDLFGNELSAGILTTFTAFFTGGSGAGTPGSNSISGSVFNDANGNGTFDDRELPMVGVVLYIDANLNGQFDASELTAPTGDVGQYSFTSLSDGTYTVREVAPAGYRVSTPTDGSRTETVIGGVAAINANFANRLNGLGGGVPGVPPPPTGGGAGLSNVGLLVSKPLLLVDLLG